MHFYLKLYVLWICIGVSIFAQVEIGADPADTNLESGAAVKKNNSDSPVTAKTLSYNKEDREKVLVILKKFYPDKSYSTLNHLLSKHMVEGSVVLSAEETQLLADVVAKDPDQGLIDKISEFALGKSDTDGLFAGIEQIRTAFAENPLSLVSKEQVKETLMKQWEGKFLGGVFKNNPKVLEFFSSLVIDKVAVPKLLDIFHKKSELKYFTVLVVIAQLMCLLAFFTLFRQSSLLGRVFKRTLLMLGVNCILILYFIWRFYPEVSPTISIFHKTFFA